MINDGIQGEQVNPGPSPGNQQFPGGGLMKTGSFLDGKRSPMIIWLNPADNPWSQLTWGTDSIQDFADALVTSGYFNVAGRPQPFHNDIIAGLDKEDVTVILKATVPVPFGTTNEQAEAPGDFLA